MSRIVKCAYCGQSKTTWNGNKQKHFFCNKECTDKFRTKRSKKLTCPCCNKIFSPKRTKQKYCSNNCKFQITYKFLIEGMRKNYSFEKRSKASKKIWEQKQDVINKRNTPENLLKISQSTAIRFKDPVFKEKHSQAVKTSMTLQRKEHLSKLAIERIQSGNNKVITRPNRIIGDLLKRIGIPFKYEQPIEDICRTDILILNEQIAIEIDGDYWHSNPLIYQDRSLTYSQSSNKINDQIKQQQLKSKYPDFKIIRLWESDIYFKILECAQKILNCLPQYSLPNYQFDQYSIIEISVDIAKDFCDKYHYLRKSFPVVPKKQYGLYWNNHLIGVAVFSIPSSGYNNSILELSRFCLVDGLPKNSASWFLSRILKLIKDYPQLQNLISYADDSLHLGTIYKATNWKSMGSTKGTYYYLNKSGEHLSRQMIYRHCKAMKIPEKDYVQRMQLTKVNTSTKTKFIYKVK